MIFPSSGVYQMKRMVSPLETFITEEDYKKPFSNLTRGVFIDNYHNLTQHM